MRKVIRHNFLRKYPIVLVNRMSDWANGMIESPTYYEKIGIKGRPLSYVLFEIDGARRVHGRCDEAVIAATMAMIGGSEKYPMNPKLAAKWAMEKCIENNHRDAYSIIFEAYESSYGECTIGLDEMDWAHPHQQDKLDDQFDDKDDDNSDIDGIIKMMDDEADSDKRVEEATNRSPAPKKKVAKKATAKKRPSASVPKKKSTQRPTPKRAATLGGASGRKSRAKFPGFVHVSGGDGHLYVKGQMTKQQAQTYANKNGATHKEKGGKLVPITSGNGKSKSKTKQEPTKVKTKSTQGKSTGKSKAPKSNSGNSSSVKGSSSKSEKSTTNKSGGAGKSNGASKSKQKDDQEMMQMEPPRVVRAVNRDQIEPTDKSGIKTKSDSDRELLHNLLRTEQTTGKNKNVDKIVAKNATNSSYFRGDLEINDDKWSKMSKSVAVSKKPFSLSKKIMTDLSGRVPKRELKLLERMINTNKTSLTQKLEFFMPSQQGGAGQINSQCGEILMMVMTTLSEENADELAKNLNDFLRENPKSKSIMEKAWITGARNNSLAIRQHLDAKYGSGGWRISSSCWDTKDGVESMSGWNYKANKSSSTDVFFNIENENGIDMLEVSLKQSLDAKMLNSGPNTIFALMENPDVYDETALDTNRFKQSERKMLVAEAKKSLADSLAIALKYEKSGDYSKMSKDRAEDLQRCLEMARDILGKKNISAKDADKLISYFENNQTNETAQKAIWKAIYGATDTKEGKANKAIMGSLSKAEKIYKEYEKAFHEEYRKNPDLANAVQKLIRQSLPLMDIIQGGEVMAAGNVAIDKATMMALFNTDDPSEFRERVDLYGPPEYEQAFIGYSAGKGSKPIPIALFRLRSEALGYGGRIKSDLDIHSKFKDGIRTAHDMVYGIRK